MILFILTTQLFITQSWQKFTVHNSSKIRLSRHSFCLFIVWLPRIYTEHHLQGMITGYQSIWGMIEVLLFFFEMTKDAEQRRFKTSHPLFNNNFPEASPFQTNNTFFFFFGSGMLQCRSSWNGRGGIWGNWCWGSGCKEFSSHGQNLLWAKQTTGRRGDSKKVVGFGKLSFLRNRDSKAVLVSWRRISLP